MESACTAPLLQPSPIPSPPRSQGALHISFSFSRLNNTSQARSNATFICGIGGGRAGAIHRHSSCVKRRSYAGQFLSRSNQCVVGRGSGNRKAPWTSFTLPRDVELEETTEEEEAPGVQSNGRAGLVADDEDGEEEAEAQGVQNGRAGLVTGTDGKDGEKEVDIGGNSVWRKFPQRYKLMAATSLAFVICNMDKVNMSVAIIPMSHQLGWNAAKSGLVQSSFFWGYAMSQLPGGFLAGRFSGKKVLLVGVLVWSLATALVPMAASFLPGLLFCRILVGLGEGVSPAAATDLIARAMPVYERSRAVSFVFGGLNVGSVVGLLLAPAIIRFFGWEVVFYLFGILGIIWCLGFDTSATEEGNEISAQKEKPTATVNAKLQQAGTPLSSAPASKTSDPHSATFDISNKAVVSDWTFVGFAYTRAYFLFLASHESRYLPNGVSQRERDTVKDRDELQGRTFLSEPALLATPWGAFFKDPAVWAMMYAHFCGNWGHYNLLSWFPTYFSEELNLDLTNSALVSLLPPLGSVLVAAAASSLADYLISEGFDITYVRKLCQSIAFLCPAACMLLVSFWPNLSPPLTAGILTIGSSLSTFTLAGLYCTHQDISPKYAGVLLGLTNTVGAIPGIVGVALTGYILDQTKSWTLALFAPSIFFYLSGVLIWNMFASSKPKDF